jgi:hypothetical protein
MLVKYRGISAFALTLGVLIGFMKPAWPMGKPLPLAAVDPLYGIYELGQARVGRCDGVISVQYWLDKKNPDYFRVSRVLESPLECDLANLERPPCYHELFRVDPNAKIPPSKYRTGYDREGFAFRWKRKECVEGCENRFVGNKLVTREDRVIFESVADKTGKVEKHGQFKLTLETYDQGQLKKSCSYLQSGIEVQTFEQLNLYSGFIRE